MATPPRRPVVRVLLCAVAAVALTVLFASLAPGLFFGSSGDPGAVGDASMPMPLAILLVVAIAAMLWLGLWVGTLRVSSTPAVAAGLLLIAIPAMAFVGYELWEYHEEPEFCAETCHLMEPAYATYEGPGENQVMAAHVEDATLCLDCHQGPGTEGEIDLMVTSARHVWKAWVTKDYDADDLGGDDWVSTVPDANCLKCHDDGMEEQLPEKHDRYEKDCAMCHSPHDQDHLGYFFPERILEVEDCTLCHDDLPADMASTLGAHGEIEVDDCRNCHTTHGLKAETNVRSCSESGCHDGDAGNQASLVALEHMVYEEEQCVACHNSAHDPLVPNITVLEANCTDCHKGSGPQLRMATALPDHGDRVNQSCTDCHKSHSLQAEGDVLGCMDSACHADGEGMSHTHELFTKEDCADCHGGPHDSHTPDPTLVSESCGECHVERAEEVSVTAHGGPECADCHDVHFDSGEAAVAGCQDTGCHSELEQQGHGSFSQEQCADCHDGGHDVRAAMMGDIDDACQDCHERQTDHGTNDCSSCHLDHPVDAPKQALTCTDSACHGDAQGEPDLRGVPHPDVTGAECADCHGGPHDPTVAHDIRDGSACTDCHSVTVTDTHGADTPHTELAAQGCDNCHDPHAAEPFVSTCADCHSTEGVAPAHDGRIDADRPNSECADCHNTAHKTVGSECTDCHVRHDLPAGTLHANAVDMDAAACTDCHSSTEAGSKTDGEHWGHGKQQCTSCHRAENPYDAPAPDYQDKIRSQVSWMRQYGGGYGEWNQDGRGAHDIDSDCQDCHGFDAPIPPHYPDEESCDSSCHSWLQGTITQQGFVTNNGADTSYTGTLDPKVLLENTTTAHGGFYDDNGCTGYCHTETPKSGEPSGQHGLINVCTDCHNYDWGEAEELNLHATHIPFVEAELAALGSDTESGYSGSCSYCHSSGDPSNKEGSASFGAGGGCYNCHLSGHDPTTVYWEMGDPAVPDPTAGDENPLAGHPTNAVAVGRGCTDCHSGATAYPAVAGDDPRPHPIVDANTDCGFCHHEGSSAGVEGPDTTASIAGSQRAWAQGNDGSVGSHGSIGGTQWLEGERGYHDAEAECSTCHAYDAVDEPVYPDEQTCGSSCHGWLQTTVYEEGFTNAANNTPHYSGSIDPLTMLQGGETKHSAVVYEENGCTGLCHNGAGDPLSDVNGAPHGSVDQCTDCHGSGELHPTHRSSSGPDAYTAKWTTADPESNVRDESGEVDDCGYCHAPSSESAGGCYNCHLSGHDPEAVYWWPTDRDDPSLVRPAT